MKKMHIHSLVFSKLLEEAADIKKAIRAITHAKPLLVFWVTPEGIVLDAKEAHHDNPPLGDKTVLVDGKFKGHLRGRAAFIGNKIYIVIYAYTGNHITRYQQALLRRTYPRILNMLKTKHPEIPNIEDALFITDAGEDIVV